MLWLWKSDLPLDFLQKEIVSLWRALCFDVKGKAKGNSILVTCTMECFAPFLSHSAS